MDANGFSTTLIRAGEGKDEHPAPLTTPIYETTTFIFPDSAELRRYNEGRSPSYLYSRYDNPTVVAVEEKLAAADAAEGAAVFGSGMAASSTLLLALLKAGDELVTSAALYGGTLHMMHEFLPKFGVTVRAVSLDALRDPAAVLSDRTRLLWFESPINPTLRCVDIAGVAAACRAGGVVSVIDNTFASPVNQQPLALGIDLVIQSASKYLAGHSDVTAGVITGDGPLLREVALTRRRLGGILDPQPAYLLGRSLKTLPLRMARHNSSGQAVAEALDGHPRVRAVFYPGLPSHPDHEIARAQMAGFGGMVCIDVDGGEAAACGAFDRLRIVRRAASLGGVESVCSLPVLTSHWGYTDDQLAAAGVTRGMMRFSIGLEEPADLIADIRQALE
jgi:cystathionine beta-lyase/cystathionine gamma-synthase